MQSHFNNQCLVVGRKFGMMKKQFQIELESRVLCLQISLHTSTSYHLQTVAFFVGQNIKEHILWNSFALNTPSRTEFKLSWVNF